MKIRISFIRFISLYKKYFFMFDDYRLEFFLQIVSAVKKAHGTLEEISIKTADLSHENLEIAMDVFKDLEIEAKPISIDEKGLNFSVSASDK